MSTSPSDTTDRPPHVLISGAGLAGLFLGILLEKAGIPYNIYERAAEIKPIGAVMCLAPNILAAFEQLGLYEELMSFSKKGIYSTYYTDRLEVIATHDSTDGDLKVHMSSQIASFEQDKGGVTITLCDNTTVRGDILVGADGAHSAVRNHLYQTLDKQGLLPKSDTEAMSVGYVSLLGTTEVLDPAKYPGLLKDDCETSFIIGDKKNPYTWATFTVPGNKICWNVIIQLGLSSIADEEVGSSDWVAQDNQVMMDSIRHFSTTYGTMGDLFDVTQSDRVSKVFFEDKLFETWNHGRVVLIGDGAVNAMQDAVLIANHIYDIKPTTHENIQTALNEYKEERFDAIKDQYPQSHISAQLMYGHTLYERILRQVIFNWMPKSVMRRQLSKNTAYRPQANFLPQAPKRGNLGIIPQWPSKRIQDEKEDPKNVAATATAV
ncbi:hypothetical protein KI688_007600 [Linnemannia hyalina]|uniref:FAD-binding domain-containing protein n=1 Tax=Linnemannia hyalina TaxID=64524 RepID=A0A9P7XI16_9FUNG|nr:hypothetical protein KI688_007600 [Linnemannia hyalina]